METTLVGSKLTAIVSLLGAVALLGGCGGMTAPSASDPGTTGSTASASTTASTTAPTTAATRPEASVSPAVVGTWVGTFTCQRIVEMFRQAGMEGQALANIVDNGLLPGVSDVAQIADPANPCSGAVELEHSHFFTAEGSFGSRDAARQQVDDGYWVLVEADRISINGTPFDFEVVGDELHLSPVDVGECPVDSTLWCPEAWKLMVAMPGMAWTRES